MILDQRTALLWLIETARYARAQGVSGRAWLDHLDPQWFALAMAYVDEKQVCAIRELTWSHTPFL